MHPVTFNGRQVVSNGVLCITANWPYCFGVGAMIQGPHKNSSFRSQDGPAFHMPGKFMLRANFPKRFKIGCKRRAFFPPRPVPNGQMMATRSEYDRGSFDDLESGNIFLFSPQG